MKSITSKFFSSSVAGVSIGTAILAFVATQAAGLSITNAQPAAVESTGIVEGPGIKIGEGTVLHPIVGAETGIISNVFFDDGSRAAGVFRVLFEGVIGSLSEQRRATSSAEADEIEEEMRAAQASRGDLEYRASLRLAYTEFLSGSVAVRSQRDLGVGANLSGKVYPQRTWAFKFDEAFHRLVRPTNFESAENTNRIINRLGLAVLYQPQSRSLHGSLRYENIIDIFEDSKQSFADRFQNHFGLRADWQFLPVTKFYADAQVGLYSGIGADSKKVSSIPLRLTIGAESALTEDTSIATYIGYGQGFYSAGADFQSILFGANFGYRYSPLGKVNLTYQHDFQDSINANYYRDHVLSAVVSQQVVPVMLTAAAEVRFRQYDGIITNVSGSARTRDDIVLTARAGAHYNFRDWIAATADYEFTSVQTDFMYTTDGVTIDPSYSRHQLLAGVRAAF
jgi:opacity protein-like surface antigen